MKCSIMTFGRLVRNLDGPLAKRALTPGIESGEAS